MIQMAVRSFVEFLLQAGDIDNRIGKTMDTEAMAEGRRIHKKIQNRMGSEYQAEVPLSILIPMEKFELSLTGRADGIIESEGKTPVVDEIKGVYMDVMNMQKPVEVHLAQAKCYAYMYASERELPEMNVRMTYCNMHTEEIRYFHEQYSMKELKSWFFQMIEAYRKWGEFQVEWLETRQKSIPQVQFPYPYRVGQKELAAFVYKTIAAGERLFIQAPTGVGKTISTVFPAVKAVGEEKGDKIFYLTAKTITRVVAKEALALLQKQGLRYKISLLTAKEKLCFCEEMDCNPVNCPYAKGHYDRVNDAVYDLLNKEDVFDREIIEKQAKEFQVCPFELGLDLSLWSDAIVCDYNYVFDPTASLKRFFAEGKQYDYIFLIDECHNLVERAREMYSAVLWKEQFLEIKKLVIEDYRKLANQLEKCNKILLRWKRECENCMVLSDLEEFPVALVRLMGEMENYFELEEDRTRRKKVMELYLECRHFLAMYEEMDDNYIMYTEFTDNGSFFVKLFCVNPALPLRRCLDKGNSTIFFSATLLPIQYYKELLTAELEDKAVYARSPFDASKRLILAAEDVTSRYKRRNRQEYEKIASYLYQMVQGKRGNYLAFFPSYAYEQQVYECFVELYGEEEISLVFQSASMSEGEREAYLQAFSVQREKSLLGFSVIGGIFSEGIDLKEDSLIGAAIIGTGLPGISKERDLLMEYFNKRNMNGFDFAYRYPGMNKVLQAAGRVIRTVEDTGVILLLDERFLFREQQSLFPREWQDVRRCRLSNVADKICDFWKSLA